MPNDEIMVAIGQRIRARREYLQLTQEEVADSIGISQGTFARVEAGKVNITAANMEVIATRLKAPVGYFYSEPVAPLLHETEMMETYRRLPEQYQLIALEQIKILERLHA